MPVLKFVGGINEQKDTDINIMECSTGQNFLLDKTTNSLRPRSSIDYLGTATNEGQIYAIMQLQSRDGSLTQLVKAGSTIYSWDMSTGFTTEATSVNGILYGFYWGLDDYLIIVDRTLNNYIAYWDSSTYATLNIGLTNPSARYGITHNGRAWFFNLRIDDTFYPNVILASEFENINNCTISDQGNMQDPTTSFTSSSDPFFLVSPDMKPINGVVEHLGSLIISTFNGGLFRLEGNDATDYNFVDYYISSSAGGNTSGPQTIQSIGNDIIYVREGPVVELLSTTARFGDTATDDISRWIPNEISTDASQWHNSHVLYDPTRQQILFMLGKSGNSRCMVLDKYRLDIAKNSDTGDVLSPWNKYITGLTFGFQTGMCYAVLLDASNKTNVYIGDANGNLMKLFGTEALFDADGTDNKTIAVSRTSKILQGREAIGTPVNGSMYYKRGELTNITIDIDFWPTLVRQTSTVPVRAEITSGGDIPTAGTQWDTSKFTPAGRGDKAQVVVSFAGEYDVEIESITL